jgi:hypothetical protein
MSKDLASALTTPSNMVNSGIEGHSQNKNLVTGIQGPVLNYKSVP